MIFIQFIVIFILLYILFEKLRNTNFSAKIGQFDGPTGLEIIRILTSKKGLPSPTECFNIAKKWMNKYDSCFAFSSWVDTYVCTSRREDVQMLFKMAHKGRVYKFFQYSLGAGLVTSSGKKWKKSRNLVDSAFAAKELSTNLLQIFNDQSRLLVDEIERKGLGVEFSLWSLIMRAVTRTIWETTFGTPQTNDLHLNQRFGSGNSNAEKLIMKRIYSPFLYPEFMFKLYLFLTKQSGVFSAIRKPFLSAIQKKKQIYLEKENSAIETSLPTRTLILDILMKSDLTDEELTDELITLMFAGTETTTTAICFTLLMLAMNPDIQEKVHEELNAVFFEDKDRPAETSDLAKLTFLEQCIKESLRKSSVIPFVERYVTTDVTMKDGRVIPAGTHFVFFIYGIHHNPEYYPNPETWNPHNFDAEIVAQRPTYTFIPFALGLRQCVGYKFAMMYMKVSLSTILRNFKLSTNQTEVEFDYNLLARCRSGYHLKFEKRYHENSIINETL